MARKIQKNKMWGSRSNTDQDKIMLEMNSSINSTQGFILKILLPRLRMQKCWEKKKIISSIESQKIISGLKKIKIEFEKVFLI